MAILKNAIIILGTSFVLLQNAFRVQGINCFQCNSNNNSACTDLELIGKNLLYPVPCIGDYGGHEPFCRKTVLELMNHNKQIEARIIRSCGWVRYKNPCYNADNEDHNERVCQCFEDGCNGSSTSTSIIYLSLLPVLIFIKSFL